MDFIERLISQDILDGTLVRQLDTENKATFGLKIRETSEGNRFRLIFTVEYVLENVSYVEEVISNPFKVTSNKRKNPVGMYTILSL
jgi:hypothetical protein